MAMGCPLRFIMLLAIIWLLKGIPFAKSLKILDPVSIAGHYPSFPAGFGPRNSTTRSPFGFNITGDVVYAESVLGCHDILPKFGGELVPVLGKIVLVHSFGGCSFEGVSRLVQRAGGIGVVFRARPGSVVGIAGFSPDGSSTDDIFIAVVETTASVGHLIFDSVLAGRNTTLNIQSAAGTAQASMVSDSMFAVYHMLLVVATIITFRFACIRWWAYYSDRDKNSPLFHLRTAESVLLAESVTSLVRVVASVDLLNYHRWFPFILWRLLYSVHMPLLLLVSLALFFRWRKFALGNRCGTTSEHSRSCAIPGPVLLLALPFTLLLTATDLGGSIALGLYLPVHSAVNTLTVFYGCVNIALALFFVWYAYRVWQARLQRAPEQSASPAIIATFRALRALTLCMLATAAFQLVYGALQCVLALSPAATRVPTYTLLSSALAVCAMMLSVCHIMCLPPPEPAVTASVLDSTARGFTALGAPSMTAEEHSLYLAAAAGAVHLTPAVPAQPSLPAARQQRGTGSPSRVAPVHAAASPAVQPAFSLTPAAAAVPRAAAARYSPSKVVDDSVPSNGDSDATTTSSQRNTLLAAAASAASAIRSSIMMSPRHVVTAGPTAPPATASARAAAAVLDGPGSPRRTTLPTRLSAVKGGNTRNVTVIHDKGVRSSGEAGGGMRTGVKVPVPLGVTRLQVSTAQEEEVHTWRAGDAGTKSPGRGDTGSAVATSTVLPGSGGEKSGNTLFHSPASYSATENSKWAPGLAPSDHHPPSASDAAFSHGGEGSSSGGHTASAPPSSISATSTLHGPHSTGASSAASTGAAASRDPFPSPPPFVSPAGALPLPGTALLLSPDIFDGAAADGAMVSIATAYATPTHGTWARASSSTSSSRRNSGVFTRAGPSGARTRGSSGSSSPRGGGGGGGGAVAAVAAVSASGSGVSTSSSASSPSLRRHGSQLLPMTGNPGGNHPQDRSSSVAGVMDAQSFIPAVAAPQARSIQSIGGSAGVGALLSAAIDRFSPSSGVDGGSTNGGAFGTRSGSLPGGCHPPSNESTGRSREHRSTSISILTSPAPTFSQRTPHSSKTHSRPFHDGVGGRNDLLHGGARSLASLPPSYSAPRQYSMESNDGGSATTATPPSFPLSERRITHGSEEVEKSAPSLRSWSHHPLQ